MTGGAEARRYHSDRVPGAEHAEAPEEKFTGYLLNEAHPDGHPKARFFARLGFNPDNWEELRAAILTQLPYVAGHFGKVNLANGQNWLASLRVEGPAGSADIVTVWAVHPAFPTRLVTAYPED